MQNFSQKELGQTRKAKSKIKKNRLPTVILALFVAVAIAMAAREWNFQAALKMPAGDDARVFPFEILQSESPRLVAKRLQSEGFVGSEKFFLRFVQRQNIDRQLQAGKFFLEKNLTIPQVAEKLTHAVAEKIKVVFPEGFTLGEMDARLARIGLIEQGDFTACILKSCDFSQFEFLPRNAAGEIARERLEGYFFPDTFFIVPQTFDLQAFARKMLRNFEKKVVQKHSREIASSGRSLEQIVIMASIVEKETRNAANRPLVADIFWRRLDTGMSLGSCSTVRFLTGNKTGEITLEQLQIDDPFNTRKNTGLPPSAICNPGLESLQAAINPKQNDFWYFLHDGKMQIHFSASLSEHNAKKRKYLQ